MIEEKVLSNVQELLVPFLEKIKTGQLDPKQLSYIIILEINLQINYLSFLRNLSAKYANLTPKEIRVANLVKHGKRKKVASLLNLIKKRLTPTGLTIETTSQAFANTYFF